MASVNIRFGPIARVAMGVVALLVSLALLADLLFGVVPSQANQQRQFRQRIAETMAVQITALLEVGDTATLSKTIAQVLARERDLRSITVRRGDGSTYLSKGDDASLKERASTIDDVRVPIFAGSRTWGEVQMRFTPINEMSPAAWLKSPMAHALLLLTLGGFALSYAYMRRAMHYLNPSASVPERVRKAFDALNEGLVIVDAQARVVLANRAFRQLHPQAEAELNGQLIDNLSWLHAGGTGEGVSRPWSRSLSGEGPVQGHPLDLPQPIGAPTRLLVSTSPIADAKGRVRGCMITFDDVTAVHRANEELRATMVELEKSRQRIEVQNGELRRLAERDPMTGCFNRRAFFAQANELFAQAKEEHAELCVVMGDIDFFKKFNDIYGHAVGDQVIQTVARLMDEGIEKNDLLCRYGGEEFCILLPGATPEHARRVTERLRLAIETHAKDSIRGVDVMRITSSFGFATVMMGASTLEGLIEQADQALYKSKENGRNQVTLWVPEVADATA
jgi:diguanylate cyclase (GGDEF)-like protein/PAS domain S-box-containing protein